VRRGVSVEPRRNAWHEHDDNDHCLLVCGASDGREAAMPRPLLRPAVVAIIVLVGLAGSAGVARAQNPPETIEYYATDALALRLHSGPP
jgi:hypothetical protein